MIAVVGFVELINEEVVEDLLDGVVDKEVGGCVIAACVAAGGLAFVAYEVVMEGEEEVKVKEVVESVAYVVVVV